MAKAARCHHDDAIAAEDWARSDFSCNSVCVHFCVCTVTVFITPRDEISSQVGLSRSLTGSGHSATARFSGFFFSCQCLSVTVLSVFLRGLWFPYILLLFCHMCDSMVQDIITHHFARENRCNSNFLRNTTLKFSGNDQRTL